MNFIVDVLNYAREDTANCVIRSTSAANALMQARAGELIKKYINAGIVLNSSTSSSQQMFSMLFTRYLYTVFC